ncbi:hypothetical protein DYB28_006831, partial [Aphanomyces astaci]
LKFESELEKPRAKKPSVSIRMKSHFNRLLSRVALSPFVPCHVKSLSVGMSHSQVMHKGGLPPG